LPKVIKNGTWGGEGGEHQRRGREGAHARQRMPPQPLPSRRLLLLFNPSGKLNGGGQADNNESARRNEHRDRNCICAPNEIMIIIISNRRVVDIKIARDFRFFEKNLFSVLFLRSGADDSCCDDKYVGTAVERFYER